MKTVLLTGARAPITLVLARYLCAAGHRVIVADSVRFALTYFSRSVARRVVVPSAAWRTDAFIAALQEIVKLQCVDLLIPTCEETFYVAQHQTSFDCDVFTSGFETLDRLHNKWTFSQCATNDYACVPETHLLESADSVSTFQDDSENWVFKPAYSRFAADTLIAPKLATLRKLAPTPDQPWLAQQRIIGREICSASILRDGELQAHVAYASKYRAGKGAGIYLQQVHHPLTEAFVRTLTAKQHFTGQLGFDFIESSDGRLHVIEANPRSTNGLAFFEHCPSFVTTFFERVQDVIRPASNSSYMMGFAMPLWGLADAIRRGTLLRFPIDFATGRDVVFRMRDPYPVCCAPLSLIEITRQALCTGNTLLHAATADMEWNGRQNERVES